MTESTTKSMDEIVALCRRRGFIFQSSEIYGGINGFWDYGPMGAELKRNLKDAWWRDIIQGDHVGPDGNPFEIVPVDCTIIMNPKVWEASGHVAGFNDPMVDDRETKQRFRADHLIGLQLMHATDNDPSTDDVDRFLGTIISSSPDEALTILEADPKAITVDPDLKLKIKSVKLDGDNTRYDQGICTVIVEFRDGSHKHASLVHVSQAVLTNHNDDVPSPFTGKTKSLTPPRMFNLMFETYVGALRSEDAKAYLRPETAQGIFANFQNVVDTSRVKVPFGIGQIGKAFRNEVTPRNFTFRSREFEQMEIEFFIPPDAAKEWYAYWRDARFAWWKSIGLAGDNLQLREHDRDELAHYAKAGAGTSDIEYRFPFTAPGFGELEGVAHRTDYDLRQHAEHSGLNNKLQYFDQQRNERYFPHVIEPSAGADRGTLALLCEAYTPTPDRSGSKAIMRFEPRMAPIKAAVLPLVNKDGLPEIGEKLYKDLRKKHVVQFDVKQSIGKRYARMDEVGTPYCFTIDSDTASDQTVTVRERDTASQERVNIDKVAEFLDEKISG